MVVSSLVQKNMKKLDEEIKDAILTALKYPRLSQTKQK